MARFSVTFRSVTGGEMTTGVECIGREYAELTARNKLTEIGYDMRHDVVTRIKEVGTKAQVFQLRAPEGTLIDTAYITEVDALNRNDWLAAAERPCRWIAE